MSVLVRLLSSTYLSFRDNQRVGPACRSTISADLLFPVAAFEPTDEELKRDNVKSEDDDSDIDDPPKRGRADDSKDSKVAAATASLFVSQSVPKQVSSTPKRASQKPSRDALNKASAFLYQATAFLPWVHTDGTN